MLVQMIKGQDFHKCENEPAANIKYLFLIE